MTSDPTNNGLRVERRGHDHFWLTWNLSTVDSSSIGVVPKPTRGGAVKNDSNEPCYQIESRVGLNGEWNQIYRGYRLRTQVNNLLPNTTYYFHMKRDSDADWGLEIAATTDSILPFADDLNQAVINNSEDIVYRIMAETTMSDLRRLLVTCHSSGMTPLMIACKKGNYKIANILLKAGSFPNSISFRSRKTAAIFSAIGGNVRIMDMLEKTGKVDWHKRDISGCNAFHHAITADKVEATQYLIDLLGLQYLEDRDGFGWTPLLRAAIVGASSSMIQLLCEKGANPNAIDKLRMKSVLIAATLNSNLEHVRILLDYNADPDYKNTVNQSAVQMASVQANACYIEEDFPGFFTNLKIEEIILKKSIQLGKTPNMPRISSLTTSKLPTGPRQYHVSPVPQIQTGPPGVTLPIAEAKSVIRESVVGIRSLMKDCLPGSLACKKVLAQGAKIVRYAKRISEIETTDN